MEPKDISEKDARAAPAHSEDYFGEYRDFWWNSDFVALMAKRLNWASRRKVLEVGCGSGHWTRTFAPYLAPRTEVSCVDSDLKWSDSKAPWAQKMTERDVALNILAADVHSLPFADHAFDFVTCQTVLIHIADASKALMEMIRVLRPGGLLLCVEPDNFAANWGETSLSRTQSIDDEVSMYEFALIRDRGRIALGKGNLSIGGRLPGMFAAFGISNIQVHLSDKTIPLFPPYRPSEQTAALGETEKWFESGRDFAREQVKENFLAGGGHEADFEQHWARELRNRELYLGAVRGQTYDQAGGTLMYLVSGEKPTS
jgi:SAM-dependent methyltransferase